MTTSISELNELRQNVEHFKNELVNCLKSELPDYKGFINDNIDDLNKVLGNSTVPDYYKVAIVGRFKVGKSSFVNALTDSRLAGVSTNPETAAISVFRYSENAYAEIDIISKEKWQELKDEHQENPEDISGANRYSGFINFDKEKNSNNADIEEQYIKQNGLSYRINAVDWTKTGQKEFLKKVKEFTSTNSPLHYLVNQITVYAPVDLLKEQIELIDTPGLADTVVFRALLTEEKVKDVDAILFLTASGGSYDQADKDFLKRQLRLGQLKQLQVIVTKIDVTYTAAKRQAKDDDDEIPTLTDFKKTEELRIRKEIAKTLDELLAGQINEEDGYRYMEQLDAIRIHFVSTHYYEDGETENSGFPQVKKQLHQILASSTRLEQSKKILLECFERVSSKIQASCENRLDAIESTYDEKKVQEQLQQIRKRLEKELANFKKKLESPLNEMAKEQAAFSKHLQLYLDKIDMLARGLIEGIKYDDRDRHWRSKRAGNWGFIHGIENRIADKIFPTVEQILNEYIVHLNNYSSSITIELDHLQKQIQDIEQKNQLAGVKPLSLAACQQNLVGKMVNKTYVENCKSGIIRNLDGFINYSKLKEVKESVSDVAGTGTNTTQNYEISKYYNELQRDICQKLESYLNEIIESFAKNLFDQAEGIKPKIEQALMAELDAKESDIATRLALSISGEKQKVLQHLSAMKDLCSKVSISPDSKIVLK